MKPFPVPTIITLLSAVALLGTLAIATEKNKTELSVLRDEAEKNSQRLSSLEHMLSLILEDNNELADKIEKETEERKLFEEEQTTLFSDVSEKFLTLENEGATSIVRKWEPFVYQLKCQFEDDEEGKGSATVEQNGSVRRFITNEHVLEENGLELLSCSLTKPGKNIEVYVSGTKITLEKEVDIGYGIVEKGIPAIESESKCNVVPEIGDSVVILGYPAIGATDSITATEGIISGFEDEYYITSAKIEKGNSGGAAIHVKNDCLLGLPTLVFRGQLESLARILPI